MTPMQTVPKGNIYEIDVFPEKFVQDIRPITVDGHDIIVSQTYVRDVFESGVAGSPCRIKKAVGIGDKYYLDCIAVRYFLSNTQNHEQDIDNLMWMESNVDNCMPVSKPPPKYLKWYSELFNQYNIIQNYQTWPSINGNCDAMVMTTTNNIGSTEIDYAIQWDVIIDGVGIMGPESPLYFIPDDRRSAASYISN
jgi:hypothetical protein